MFKIFDPFGIFFDKVWGMAPIFFYVFIAIAGYHIV